jgi:hypothetical protein
VYTVLLNDFCSIKYTTIFAENHQFLKKCPEVPVDKIYITKSDCPLKKFRQQYIPIGAEIIYSIFIEG